MNISIFSDALPEAGDLRTNRFADEKSSAHFLKSIDPTDLLLYALGGLFVLFLFSGPILRLVDPMAAAPDIGTLGLPLLGLLAGLGFITISRWLLGLLWPVFRDFRKHHFEPIFKSLQPWQKIIIYLSCYFLLLYALVLCLVAVF